MPYHEALKIVQSVNAQLAELRIDYEVWGLITLREYVAQRERVLRRLLEM